MPNAENVVNPPKTPMIKNSLNEYLDKFMILSFIKSPIKKHPKILIIKVPMGNSFINNLLNNIENKYLDMDPINPPIPINNSNFNLN